MLWAYRTTTRTVTKETHYSLVYRLEEVLPLELIVLTDLTTNLDTMSNDEGLRANRDVSIERSEVATI